jgi:hypothetical protein
MNLKKLAANLSPGKPYTLFKYGEFGFPYSIKMKVEKVEIKPYAQYPETLLICYIEKGKRKVKGIRIYGAHYEKLAIWEGLHDVNTEMYVETVPGTTPGIGSVSKSLSSFSPEYLDRALQSVPYAPMFMMRGE